jgi:hypothetical protein
VTVVAITGQIRSGSWASGLPAQGPGGGCTDIPGFAGFLLGHVAPLREWFDGLLGDPGTVSAFAGRWEDSEQALNALANDLRAADRALAQLDGRTVRALHARYRDLIPTAQDAAEWTGATAAATRLVSQLVQAARDFICDFLGALSRFAQSLFHFTLNPLKKLDDIKRFAESAAEFVAAGGRLVKDLTSAIGSLVTLLQKLGPLIAEGLEKLKDVLADMAPYAGILTGGPLLGTIFGNVAHDFLHSDAGVEELDPSTLTGDKLKAWNNANSVTQLDSLADLVAVNGTTDAMGGEDATAIDIKKVIGPDGKEHWIVSLPSTQAWEFTGPRGAMNDRDSNVALMLDNPLLKTQYERAVLQAMKNAGIPQNAPVVLTGFSQGGIMAANLASDPSFPYKPIGVVTNGSPIDSFTVPSHVPVYAFQHATDVVPMLDGTVARVPGVPGMPSLGVPGMPGVSVGGSNVHQITLPDPGGEHLFGAHNNTLYTQSVKNWEQANNPGDRLGIAGLGGTVVEHQVYTTHE